MNVCEMTEEEWAEVRRRHDALIRMAELEMQAEMAGEPMRPPAPRPRPMIKPVERELRGLYDVAAAKQH